MLRLIQQLPRNPFFTNDPPKFYLFYLHSEGVVSLFEVEDVREGEVVEVVSGLFVLGADEEDAVASLGGVIST